MIKIEIYLWVSLLIALGNINPDRVCLSLVTLHILPKFNSVFFMEFGDN